MAAEHSQKRPAGKPALCLTSRDLRDPPQLSSRDQAQIHARARRLIAEFYAVAATRQRLMAEQIVRDLKPARQSCQRAQSMHAGPTFRTQGSFARFYLNIAVRIYQVIAGSRKDDY